MSEMKRLDADLVLEGGGVKGVALAGAVAVLEERGYRFHKVAGTSAGAIVGSLVAAGATGARLRDIMNDLDYRRFRDPPLLGRLGPLGVALEIAVNKGWCRGDYFRAWLAEKLAEFGVKTFADLALHDEESDPALHSVPERAYRFVAMAADVTHGELVRLPWCYRQRFGLKPGEVEVADAVRASMAIPFFFRPMRCPDQIAGGKAWLVDGGVLSNFPIEVFDRTDGTVPRWPTFGIKLSARSTVSRINEIHGVVALSRAMLSTMAGFHDRIHIGRQDVLARTIFVDTGDVRATDFDLSPATALDLYERGRIAATTFLDGDSDREAWDFEAYLCRHRVEVASH
ncbi:MAG TPA: patatin-like phospholipase family protein [Candidatus Limnocylindrales bacterium]|nr:patatin-like phospholipase family protein [Candidatus Limnocylindrales bacterium]